MTDEVKMCLVLLVWLGAITIYLISQSLKDIDFGERVREAVFEEYKWNFREQVNAAVKWQQEAEAAVKAAREADVKELAAQVAAALKEGKE